MLKMLQKIVFVFFMLLFMMACHQEQDDVFWQKKQFQITQKAYALNENFSHIRRLVKHFAEFVKMVFENKSNLKMGFSYSKYDLYANTVYYKPEDDGGSAVFVSGIMPVTTELKEKVRFTEFLDLFMLPAMSSYPEFAQIYYNDRDSYCRIYPYFDVLSQFEPRMNIPEFNFYYLADEKHNPQKKSVWVDEPYLDPAGRGWMISAIAPVYLADKLQGVAGVDITLKTIIDRYFSEKNGFMLITRQGQIISIDEKVNNILELPHLIEGSYIETVKSDTYLPEEFNFLKSKNRLVRKIGQQVLTQGKKKIVFEKEERRITLINEKINELGWILSLLVEDE